MKKPHQQETDHNGNVMIGPKRIPVDLYDYLVEKSKEKGVYQVTIIIEALKLHREQETK